MTRPVALGLLATVLLGASCDLDNDPGELPGVTASYEVPCTSPREDPRIKRHTPPCTVQFGPDASGDGHADLLVSDYFGTRGIALLSGLDGEVLHHWMPDDLGSDIRGELFGRFTGLGPDAYGDAMADLVIRAEDALGRDRLFVVSGATGEILVDLAEPELRTAVLGSDADGDGLGDLLERRPV